MKFFPPTKTDHYKAIKIIAGLLIILFLAITWRDISTIWPKLFTAVIFYLVLILTSWFIKFRYDWTLKEFNGYSLLIRHNILSMYWVNVIHKGELVAKVKAIKLPKESITFTFDSNVHVRKVNIKWIRNKIEANIELKDSID